jgi:hypothetical protein
MSALPGIPVSRPAEVPPGIPRLLASLLPGAQIVSVERLAADAAPEGGTAKAAGYGAPLRVVVTTTDGAERSVVFRTASSDEFGHDRRSDRAQSMLLDYDTFGRIPRHVPALDIGAIAQDGTLVSLRDCGEFYLVTPWVHGMPYAQDLRRIARGNEEAIDVARCESLARYLVGLHQERRDDAATYRRTIRDLLGHGEGIFGMVDGYSACVPAASHERLREIERRCLEWRWRLRERNRLARIHGDYHPFNVVFQEGTEFTVLDTSRGSEGDPADDVTCMAVNYVFFALEATPAGRQTLRGLWRRFWSIYLDGTRDQAVLEVAAPFLAWRCLVLASPRFYPALPTSARDAILSLAERSLAAPRLDPVAVEELFR